MAEVHAFRGLRYDMGHVGSLSDVVAPPYDVIDRELQDELYQKHPANVIRLILNRIEPGDNDQTNRYTRAANFLKNWRREGVLRLEPDPALYVYHQEFEFAGQRFLRHGFMGRIRLERFGEGTIYAHEQTHAAAKADRLKLIRACRANLSQIFGIYPDPRNQAQQRLDAAIQGVAPFQATDHLGVIHRLWPVTDVKTVADVAAFLGPKPLFVADGHHRYETACNYRDELAARTPLDPTHPANFVLMMCVSMDDQGMIVLPTHRLFRGLPELTSEQWNARLGDCFTTEIIGRGPDGANQVWQRIEAAGDQGAIGLYATADQTWLLACITDKGHQRMTELAPDKSPQWRQLGVAILQRLIIETLLDKPDLPKPEYVHQVSEVVDALRTSDSQQAPYPLASLVMPANLDHVRAISEHAERMPAKSTYFYPKLLSGLVINPLTA